MSLNPIRLLLPFGVVCFAAAALAQKPYDWVNNPPPAEAFASVLEKLWAASAEAEPFKSVRAGFPLFPPGWSTNVAVPGVKTSDCEISKNSKDEGSNQIFYQCSVLYKKGADAKKASANLEKLVESSRQDWTISPTADPKTGIPLVKFTSKSDLGGNDDLVRPKLNRMLQIMLILNSAVLQIAAE